MAEATDIPYHELTHVSDWYLREETIRRAIVAPVDYHHSLPLSAVFGPGTTATPARCVWCSQNQTGKLSQKG